MTTDTPRTDAVFWRLHTHEDLVNLAKDLTRHQLETSSRAEKAEAEVERLKKVIESL